MAILDLFKERKPHTVILDVGGEAKEFKIPTAYTVEEIERITELQVEIDRLAEQEVKKEDETQQVNAFWDAVFAQLLVLFNHYNPELTLEELKKYLTREEAQAIVAFHASQQILVAQEKGAKGTKKKATKKS